MEISFKKLDKSYIEEKVTHEEIYSKFLNITLTEIQDCVNNNQLIRSPLRIDNNPTVGFRWIRGRLKMKDFAGHFFGDCYDVVGYLHNIDAEDSIGFNIILELIAKEFKLHQFSVDTEQTRKKIEKLNSFHKDSSSPKQFDLYIRTWDRKDLYFWKKFGIQEKTLNSYKVFPVASLSINQKVIYTYNPFDPGYAYLLGVINNTRIWKVYFPYRKKYKFITNGSFFQGVQNLIGNTPYLLITKSLKDVMSFVEIRNKAKIKVDVVALPSENSIITLKQYNKFNTLGYKYIFSLLDFDLTGVRTANQMRKRYNINPLFLTNGRFKSIDYGAKDLSDKYESIKNPEDLILYTKIVFDSFKTNNYIEMYDARYLIGA